MKKIVFSFFIIAFITNINFAHEFPIDIVSIRYANEIYISDNQKEISIPIIVTFYNKDMKLFFFKDYPYIDLMLFSSSYRYNYFKDAKRLYEIPPKNKSQIKKDQWYKYQVKIGHDLKVEPKNI